MLFDIFKSDTVVVVVDVVYKRRMILSFSLKIIANYKRTAKERIRAIDVEKTMIF